jgi:DNA-binding NtrC family response regulator
MEHKILIVDDDKIFNSLLSDVFKQAGYDVHSAESADNALEMLKTIEVDLIVTDQRMPGTTGTQFVHKLLGTHKGLPVVIVSGFLNNDDIRRLIEDGIGGVFIKPLNIFQLLKRAAQLIEKREHQLKTQTDSPEQKAAAANGTPQVFRGATSPAAVKFLKQLESLRGFTSNLLITGGDGTDFETICQDISSSNNDTTFAVAPEEADDPAKLSARLCGLATKDDGRITVVLDDIEAMTQSRTETILALSRSKPPFDKLGTHVRFIFCLKSNLDALLDAGRINENLYLFMGTTELKVPSLEDLKDDIPTIAQSMLERIGAACRLDEGAAQELKAHHWTGGMKQLASVLHEAVAATPGNTITAEAVRGALAGGAATKSDGNLRDYLLKARREYANAMLALYGGDKKAAAEGLEIKDETLARIVSEK